MSRAVPGVLNWPSLLTGHLRFCEVVPDRLSRAKVEAKVLRSVYTWDRTRWASGSSDRNLSRSQHLPVRRGHESQASRLHETRATSGSQPNLGHSLLVHHVRRETARDVPTSGFNQPGRVTVFLRRRDGLLGLAATDRSPQPPSPASSSTPAHDTAEPNHHCDGDQGGKEDAGEDHPFDPGRRAPAGLIEPLQESANGVGCRFADIDVASSTEPDHVNCQRPPEQPRPKEEADEGIRRPLASTDRSGSTRCWSHIVELGCPCCDPSLLLVHRSSRSHALHTFAVVGLVVPHRGQLSPG